MQLHQPIQKILQTAYGLPKPQQIFLLSKAIAVHVNTDKMTDGMMDMRKSAVLTINMRATEDEKKEQSML